MVQGMNSTDICTLILVFQGFSPAKVIFAGVGVLLAVHIPTLFLRTSHHNTDKPQTARDIRSSQKILIDLFERVENFFRRLEIYTEVPPTLEMMDMMVNIMVEVLSILGIATKEIEQGRTSE